VEAIARALILAVQYINDRSEEHTPDDDVKALEEAASIVQEATPEERETLIKVARELGLQKWPEQIGMA
jgi:hypothetical protein